MSATSLEEDGTLRFCASCGDECENINLVRYCSDECQQEHKKTEHEEACKKREAELRDELCYSGNRRAPILGTVRSAVYLCRLN